MLSRREFIKGTLSAGVIAGSGMIFGACSGAKREACHAAPEVNPAPLHVSDAHREILYLASLAPSSHNTQPWQVRGASPNCWIIQADPRGKLPAVDPHNRELLLSIGAFIENLAIAAGSMGFSAQVEVIARSSLEKDVARIVLTQDAFSPYPVERIRNRRTVRNGQLNKEISTGHIKTFMEAAEGQVIYFPTGSQDAHYLQDAAVENFRIQTNRDAAQRELVRWLRLNDTVARMHRDGLSAEGMEITGVKGWFVRHYASPEDFMKQGYRKQGIDQVANLAGQGGGWLVITSRGDSPAELIDTGRRFERLALVARELNIGIHPMSQILEEQRGAFQIAGSLPQFVLRVGYVHAYPRPVSLRRPVERFFRLE